MEERWKPAAWPAVIGALAAIGIAVWLWCSSPEHWVRILDDANLIFHEAGHPIFGILGPTLGLYGGTLGQLAFPTVTSAHFWRQREPVAFTLCSAWFFENILNISRYMADARSQILPLVGGGEHDWTSIFSRWHVLPHDTTLAACTAALGWLGILCSCLWLLSLAFKGDGV